MPMAYASNKRSAPMRCSHWVMPVVLLAAQSAFAATPPTSAKSQTTTVAEIVRRNAEARGGAEAWKNVQTMVWAGHTESSSAPDRKLPFLLELRRPARMRFEIGSVSGQLVRIYDGTNGWKVHPDSNGIPDVKDYSADELAFARSAQIIDGPLMDMAARDANLKLIGTDTLGDRKAFVIESRTADGGVSRVWVDAETFLEARLEREIAVSGGRTATSTIVFRNYRAIKGLQVPTIVETGSGAGRPTDTLVIEKIALNPEIEDKTFMKPQVGTRAHGGIIVDTRGVAAGQAPPQPSPAQPRPTAQPQPLSQPQAQPQPP
jgi:outer membrane lipoprotein-sorting protein